MRSDETSITMKQFLRQTRRSCFIRPTNLMHAGTLIFVLFSTAVVTSGCHTKDVKQASGDINEDAPLEEAPPGSCFLSSTSVLLNIAFGFGFTLFVVIYVCASFSGGHINPAVTLAMFLARKISFVRGFLYVVFQCSGAAIGSVILKGLDPAGFAAAAGAANQVSDDFGDSGGAVLGYEILFTFALVFVVFAATDPMRQAETAHLPILAPLSIGLIVFVAHLVLVPIDGCSLNPARTFGPAVVSRTFNHNWIFWVGPFIGGAAGAMIYDLLFRDFYVIDEDGNKVHTDVPPKAGPNPHVDLERGRGAPIALPQATAV